MNCLEKNERPGSLLPERDTQIQLVLNNPDQEEDSIDLGRVFHNMKVKSRIYAWVLILCMVVGFCAPVAIYALSDHPLTVTSVVTLRYGVATLLAPDGTPLDLSTVTSAPVLQKALDGITLSKNVSIENLRNNITVRRVLTEASSRDREILAGLADAKDKDVYTRLEETELQYQNRFIVSLTNGFGDADASGEVKSKIFLRDEELSIILNRVLDAYNDTLIRQYANVRLPEDRVSLIDTEVLDIPETLDSLGDALTYLNTYCAGQPANVKSYRSWQTGLTLNDWITSINSIRTLRVDYLDAYVYARGIFRDKETLALSYKYKIRNLQNDLDEVTENMEKTQALLRNYKNSEVLVNLQESDSARSTTVTTEYYNELVLRLQGYIEQSASLRTQIAETQNKLDRLDSSTNTGEVEEVEAELKEALASVQGIQDGVRAHMTELFGSALFTTYTDHSVPQGENENFITANLKKIIIGTAVGAVAALAVWFLAALAPEFRRRRDDDNAPKAEKAGKEAQEA